MRIMSEHLRSRTLALLVTYLLHTFFYYAFDFDWRRQVVSIKSRDVMLKETKARKYGWKRHARLSIADPFEESYDVGHVLRDETSRRLRSEFGRAYMILSGATGKRGTEAINELLEIYVEPQSDEEKNGDP